MHWIRKTFFSVSVASDLSILHRECCLMQYLFHNIVFPSVRNCRNNFCMATWQASVDRLIFRCMEALKNHTKTEAKIKRLQYICNSFPMSCLVCLDDPCVLSPSCLFFGLSHINCCVVQNIQLPWYGKSDLCVQVVLVLGFDSWHSLQVVFKFFSWRIETTFLPC